MPRGTAWNSASSDVKDLSRFSAPISEICLATSQGRLLGRSQLNRMIPCLTIELTVGSEAALFTLHHSEWVTA